MRGVQYLNEILYPMRFLLSGKVRPLCKAISSQLALSSFELLNLKPPILEGRRYE